MHSAKHAMNYVSESLQGAASSSSKEVNKSIARDPNIRASTRLSAAKNAIGDKLSETAHRNKAETHRQFAKA